MNLKNVFEVHKAKLKRSPVGVSKILWNGLSVKRYFWTGFILAAFFLLSPGAVVAQGLKTLQADRDSQVEVAAQLASPDRQTVLLLGIRGDKAAAMATGRTLMYKIRFGGRDITDWSELGWESNGRKMGTDVQQVKLTKSRHRENISWRLGASDHIENNYTQGLMNTTTQSQVSIVAITAKQKANSHGRAAAAFDMEWRVFNGAVALRYLFKAGTKEAVNSSPITIQSEMTAFRFLRPVRLWQYNQESVFTPMALSQLTKSSDLPTTLTDTAHSVYYSIGEADNEGYTKAVLKKTKDGRGIRMAFDVDTTVQVQPGSYSPWRTICFASSAIGLLEFSDLYMRLVDVKTKQVPGFIKPGKLIRCTQLNTESGKRCVDFALKHHFQYVLFDAGWYGKEFRSTSNPATCIEGLDIPGIARYGREKGIGILLYVNYVGLSRHLDTLLPLYKKWGIAGMKFGFVDGLSQKGLQWLYGAIEKTTAAGFVLDIHDNYKPTGLSRRFPALLTQEGIRGDENSPDAFHTTTLPFTRFLAGPADFTFCFPNSKNSFSKNLKVSKAQQMALTIIYQSPLQSIFWYGKPEDYTDDKEIEFFDFVPTVWDQSVYLQGAIGQYISVARRRGKDWFIGNVAGPRDWNSRLSLDFLRPGKTYRATIYKDSDQNGIKREQLTLKKGMTLPIHLQAAKGEALILREL